MTTETGLGMMPSVDTTTTLPKALHTCCSCGCSAPHKISRRETSDGVHLHLWSDGSITYALGLYVRGVGVARSAFEAERNVEAGHLAFSVIELYDFSEVARLVQSARRAVRQHCDRPREAMMRYFRGERIRAMKAGRTFRWEKA